MDRTELDRLFERLLAEPEDAAHDADAMLARVSLFAALPVRPSAEPSNDMVSPARMAAYLDGALDPADAERFAGALLRAPDEIYELEAAQLLVDRVSARKAGVPQELVAAVVGHAVDESSKPVLAARSYRFQSWRSLGWIGGAIAASLVAVVGLAIRNGEDVGLNTTSSSMPASEKEQPAQARQVDPASVTPPSTEQKDKAGPEVPAPVYTAPNPPQPITSHAIMADDYPEISVRLQEQGSVEVTYVVGVDGNVTDCRVTMSSGYPRLDAAACGVVARWRYTPATVLDKTPIAMWMKTNVVFQLR